MSSTMEQWYLDGYQESGEFSSRHRVGAFYESCTAEMIEGEVNGIFDDGDVINKELGIAVESKARSNHSSFEIRVAQQEAFVQNADAPYLAYCFWAYKGWRRYKKDEARPKGVSPRSTGISELSQCRTVEELYKLLSVRTHRGFLLGLGITEALRRFAGQARTGPLGRKNEPHFRLRRRDLYRFANASDAESFLLELGLAPEEWVVDSYEMLVHHSIDGELYPTSFELFTVLGQGAHGLVSPVLSRRAVRKDGLPF